MTLVKQYVTKEVHISEVKAGYTILHEDSLRTVSANDIKTDGFLGDTLFGDSYNAGMKNVILVGFPRWVSGEFSGYAF